MNACRCFAVFGACCALCGASWAAHYDLARDWSDLTNPFGVWSLRKSRTALFGTNLPDYGGWGPNQHAWADEPYPQNAHVPLWFRSIYGPPVTSTSVRVGDVYAHGAELDRTGSDFTSAVWTSPLAGVVHVRGSIYTTWFSGRTQTLLLLKNGVVVSQASITANGTNMIDRPVPLSALSGGSAALTQQVQVGDQIELAILSGEGGNLGDTWGVSFAIADSEGRPLIDGKVQIEGFTRDLAGSSARYELLESPALTVVAEGGTVLGAGGRYSIEVPDTVPAGTYRLRFKTPTSLSRLSSEFELDVAGPWDVDFVLPNGDCDDDNMVTVFDYNCCPTLSTRSRATRTGTTVPTSMATRR